MGKVCHSIHSAKLYITIEIARIHPLYMTMVQLASDYVDEMPLKGKLQAIPSDERATRLVDPHVHVPLHTHPKELKTSMTIQTSPHYIFMAHSSWLILEGTEGTWGSITQLISWMAVILRPPLHLYKSCSSQRSSGWMNKSLGKCQITLKFYNSNFIVSLNSTVSTVSDWKKVKEKPKCINFILF